jgi:hypothetical protein
MIEGTGVLNAGAAGHAISKEAVKKCRSKAGGSPAI